MKIVGYTAGRHVDAVHDIGEHVRYANSHRKRSSPTLPSSRGLFVSFTNDSIGCLYLYAQDE